MSEQIMERFPLEYIDGPDYCTVKDATGADFALTVQPNVMKVMEQAFLLMARVTMAKLLLETDKSDPLARP